MLRPSKDWKIVNHYIHLKSWCILNPIWDNHNILLHLKAKSFIVWHVFIVQSRYIIIPPAISMAAFIGLALILFPCLCLVRYTNYLYIQGVQEFGYFKTSRLYKIPQTPKSLETSSNEGSNYICRALSLLFVLSVQEGSKLMASHHFLRGQNMFGLEKCCSS
jgi:hypothetical protein